MRLTSLLPRSRGFVEVSQVAESHYWWRRTQCQGTRCALAPLPGHPSRSPALRLNVAAPPRVLLSRHGSPFTLVRLSILIIFAQIVSRSSIWSSWPQL